MFENSRPLFSPDDSIPEQRRLSQRILQVTTLGFAVLLGCGAVLFALANWIKPDDLASFPRRLSFFVLTSLAFAVASWLGARAYVRSAVILCLTMSFLMVINAIYFSRFGIHAPVAPILLLLIYMVGLICGKRDGWLVVAGAVLVYLFGWLAGALGWINLLPTLDDPTIAVSRVTVLTGGALMSGWIVAHFSDAFRQALSATDQARREAEQARDKAQEKAQVFLFVTDATPANIVEWSQEQICLFSNVGFARFLGRPLDQVIGRRYADLMPPAAVELNMPHLLKALAGEPQSYQVSGIIDGVEHSYLMRYIPHRHEGAVVSVLSVAVDVSELRAMEKSLEERTRQAESASVAKSQFLATMSHELRTPLNGILGNAELLTMMDFSESERKESLDIITKSGKQLLALLNSVMDLAVIESGDVRLRHDEFNLASMLADLQMAYASAAKAKGLSIRLSYAEQAGWNVVGDHQRLHQMMAILLDNAIKFSAQGEIVLSLHVLDSAQPNCVELSVTDQGIGIADLDIGKLFQSFVQVDGSATRRYEGTGLGLIKVRRLAELMAGDVTVSSEPGKGSRFSVSLRLERSVS